MHGGYDRMLDGQLASPGQRRLRQLGRVLLWWASDVGAGGGAGPAGGDRDLTPAGELLEQHGYEPERSSQHTLRLRNCPFHTLARRAPEIVCAINQALLDGLLRGLGDQPVQAVLAPRPNACCVELRAPGPWST